ncbi:MAG: peptidoglycan-binding protein [Clostridia bacterium]
MNIKKIIIIGAVSFTLSAGVISSYSTPAYASSYQNTSIVMKVGSTGTEVKDLQLRLKELGYFHANTTGYYGSITKGSVIQFQKDKGLLVDGIAGPQTLGALSRNTPQVSRGAAAKTQDLLVPWFNGAENIFKKWDTATVTDVGTGISFKIQRVTGYNHADVETLTKEDTAVLKKIYGGSWSWERRAVIVNVNGREMAASLAAMPHAGREDKPFGQTVDSRSGNYGRGANLDGVKGNNMSGVIDLHFYQSKTHGTNRVDSAHQKMVQKAAQSR